MGSGNALIAKIRHTIHRERLLEAGDRVLVAVSGGMDSVVLLDALVQLQAQLQITLAVVHVEHGLRGAESLADAHFVEALARQYGLPFFMERFAVADYAKEHRISTQVAAREVRYGYIAQAAQEFGANKVATAHHADDQAETVLMRLLRGTTLRGLGGIPMRRTEGGYELVRPLLETWRAEIEAYVADQEMSYREDSSNASTKYLRNKIRIQLLPTLESEYNLGVKDALLQMAQLAREDDNYLTELAQDVLAEVAEGIAESVRNGRVRIDVKRLADKAFSLQRRVITLILYYLRGNTKQWEQVHIENIRSLLLSDSPSAEISLPDGLRAWREYDVLYVGDESDRQPIAADSSLQPVPVKAPGVYLLPEYGIRLELAVIEGVPARPQNAWEAQFDADELSGSCIYIRTWVTGDTICPLGLRGTKLISDVLGEAKVPRQERSRWPLLCVDDTIAWVVGIRRGQQAAVTELTTRTLVLRAVEYS